MYITTGIMILLPVLVSRVRDVPFCIYAKREHRVVKGAHVLRESQVTRRFPDEMPTNIKITLNNGLVLNKEKTNYEGFHSSPMHWDTVTNKFESVAEPYTDQHLRTEIITAVSHIEDMRVHEFSELLKHVKLSGMV